MENNELQHFGVKGMKWGIRRYQNKDGTLTAAGKKRYGTDDDKPLTKEDMRQHRRDRLHSLSTTNSKWVSDSDEKIFDGDVDYIFTRNRSGSRVRKSTNTADVEEVGKMLSDGHSQWRKKTIESGSASDEDIALDKFYTTYMRNNPNAYAKALLESVEEREVFNKQAMDSTWEETRKKVKHSDYETFDDYLAHHGIKGQKWGLRRFQNKDGTLTAAGKKRYAQEMERLKKEEKILKNKQRTKAQLDKLEAKRKEIEEQKKALNGKPVKPEKVERSDTKKKSIKDMSDEELSAAVNRLRLEKSYKDLIKEQNSKGEEASTSKGKAFAKAVWKDMVRPAITEGGKEALKKTISNAADNKPKDADPVAKLEKTVKKMKLENEYNELLKKKKN